MPGGELAFETRAGRPVGPAPGRRAARRRPAALRPRAARPAVLGDTLGPVREVYRAGAQSVLAVVEDYDALCGLAVDPMSLFLVPSSMVIAACAGGPGRRRVDPRLRAAPRAGRGPRHGQRHVRDRAVVGRDQRARRRSRSTRRRRAGASCSRASSSATSRSPARRGPSSAATFAHERRPRAGPAHPGSPPAGRRPPTTRRRSTRSSTRRPCSRRRGRRRRGRRACRPCTRATAARSTCTAARRTRCCARWSRAGEAFVTATLYDGLRLARSGFESSIAYRSVVVVRAGRAAGRGGRARRRRSTLPRRRGAARARAPRCAR